MNEGDLVLCTVEKVTNTITFVQTESGREGTIISSEIAPGRIKFMRQYVVPNKKIVCKVLKDTGIHLNLSLRRVNSKEKKEVMQGYKQEQAISVALNQILGSRGEETKRKILEEFETLSSFVDGARENESLIEKFVGRESVGVIKKIIDKKRKSHELKKNIQLKCLEDDGLKRIKRVLKFSDEKIKISYLSAGEFSLKLRVEDFKAGKKRMNEIIEEIEARAKKEICEFEHSEEK